MAVSGSGCWAIDTGIELRVEGLGNGLSMGYLIQIRIHRISSSLPNST